MQATPETRSLQSTLLTLVGAPEAVIKSLTRGGLWLAPLSNGERLRCCCGVLSKGGVDDIG